MILGSRFEMIWRFEKLKFYMETMYTSKISITKERILVDPLLKFLVGIVIWNWRIYMFSFADF